MSRGGARNGTNGKGYAQRTDLGGQNVVGPRPSATGQVPIQAAPGQTYGAGAAQKASQQVVPMAGAPSGQAPMQPQGGALSATPPPLTGVEPGHSSLPNVFGPTQRPDEHFMTGVNTGGGQDGSALAPNPFINNQANSILAVLNTIQSPSSQVNFTKNYLAMQQENQMPH